MMNNFLGINWADKIKNDPVLNTWSWNERAGVDENGEAKYIKRTLADYTLNRGYLVSPETDVKIIPSRKKDKKNDIIQKATSKKVEKDVINIKDSDKKENSEKKIKITADDSK